MTQIWTQVLMRMKKLSKEQKTTNMNYEHEQNKKRWKALQSRSKLIIPSSKHKQVHKTIKTFAKYTHDWIMKTFANKFKTKDPS